MNKTKRPEGLTDQEYIAELEYKLDRLNTLYWHMAEMFDKVNSDNLQYQVLSQVKLMAKENNE